MNRIRTISILALDDDPEALEILRDHIDRSGFFGYRDFSNYKDLLDNLGTGMNIVIIDDRMPGQSGLEVMKEIKKRNRFNYVIGFTGMKEPGRLIKYMRAGVNDWIDKDKDPDQIHADLVESLEKALDFGVAKEEVYNDLAKMIKK